MTAQCGWAAFTEEQGPQVSKARLSNWKSKRSEEEEKCNADEEAVIYVGKVCVVLKQLMTHLIWQNINQQQFL